MSALKDEEVFALLDELRAIATERGVRIEVETEELALAVTAERAAAPISAPAAHAAPAVPPTQRVHAAAVGIFSAAKDWASGEMVTRGTVLGAIQTLGHMVDVVSPADGRIDEVLVAGGAPVEYGQPLFAIALG